MADGYSDQGELPLPERDVQGLDWVYRTALSYGPLPPQPEEVHAEERGFAPARDISQQTHNPFDHHINMAPGYRVNNQSRRANRSYVDHDVFEGLPVRNWRREVVSIAPPPIHEVQAQKDKWDVELPWGMPKDSHLLPQHSQDLLRAARSGRLYVRRPPVEEEEVEPDATTGEKPEKKEEEPKEKGFAVRTWKLVPRHLEGPEIEYLAKKRKGITGQAIKPAADHAPAMTKATVRRTDAAGNSYVENVVIQEGQTVTGELLAQRVITSAHVNGAASHGLPTQQRRKPAQSRRRARGSGRARRRKRPTTSIPSKPSLVKVEGGSRELALPSGSVGPDGIKLEASVTPSNENEIEDTEMGDDSGPASDDDGEEGSDEEEGEGQVEGDEEVGPSGSRLERIRTNKTNESNETDGPNDSIGILGDHGQRGGQEREISSSPDLPLARMVSGILHDHGPAGSPLRNVITLAPTYDEHMDVRSDDEAEADGDLDESHADDRHATLGGAIEADDVPSVFHVHPQVGLPPENPDPYSIALSADRDATNMMSMQPDQGYGDDDGEMLLDRDVPVMEEMAFNPLATPMQQLHHQQALIGNEKLLPTPTPDHDQAGNMTDFNPLHQDASHSHDVEATLEAPLSELQYENMASKAPQPPQASPIKARQDAFEDLLGSLEDHLDAHDHAVLADAAGTPRSETMGQEQAEPGNSTVADLSEESGMAVDEVSSMPVAAPLMMDVEESLALPTKILMAEPNALQEEATLGLGGGGEVIPSTADVGREGSGDEDEGEKVV